MMQLPITGGQQIGFSESAAGRETFRSTDPQRGAENPWTFYEASESEINQALEAARAAAEPYARSCKNWSPLLE